MSASPGELRRSPHVKGNDFLIVVQDGIKKQPITNDDEEGFPQTPTAAESKIPTAMACPPAPKKVRVTATPTCRRRLLIHVLPEDVDRLFLRPSSQPPPPPPILTAATGVESLPLKKRKRKEFDEQ